MWRPQKTTPRRALPGSCGIFLLEQAQERLCAPARRTNKLLQSKQTLGADDLGRQAPQELLLVVALLVLVLAQRLCLLLGSPQMLRLPSSSRRFGFLGPKNGKVKLLFLSSSGLSHPAQRTMWLQPGRVCRCLFLPIWCFSRSLARRLIQMNGRSSGISELLGSSTLNTTNSKTKNINKKSENKDARVVQPYLPSLSRKYSLCSSHRIST